MKNVLIAVALKKQQATIKNFTKNQELPFGEEFESWVIKSIGFPLCIEIQDQGIYLDTDKKGLTFKDLNTNKKMLPCELI